MVLEKYSKPLKNRPKDIPDTKICKRQCFKVCDESDKVMQIYRIKGGLFKCKLNLDVHIDNKRRKINMDLRWI